MRTVHIGQVTYEVRRERYTLPNMKLIRGSSSGSLCPTLSQYELRKRLARIGNGNISSER